jgi:hypothetical protein
MNEWISQSSLVAEEHCQKQQDRGYFTHKGKTTICIHVNCFKGTASYPVGTGVLSPGLKWPGREADHSPPSSVAVKNGGATRPLPLHVFMAWCLIN